MSEKKHPHKLIGIAARLLMVFGGIGCAFAVGLFAADQLNLLPSTDPLENRPKNVTLNVEYTEVYGDLFYAMPGRVKPPENPALLSSHTVVWDDNGFRVPAMKMESYADYPIVALGDSFTDAWMVETPWVDVLARELNTPVLNLSYRGYGPIEEAEIMTEYGKGEREWVLVGFFEGNDLQNIYSALEAQASNPLTALLREAIEPEPKIVLSEDGNYPYPLALYIGDDYYELAFYDYYLWTLNAERPTYTDSTNFVELKKALEKIVDASGGACVGLVYMPEKAHLYFRYTEPYGRRWILENGSETVLNGANWLTLGYSPNIDFEKFVARLGNQRDAVQALVEGMGIHFIDLTPVFEQKAAESTMLYFTYDTHWNPQGHEVAGQTIADYIQTNGCEK